MSNKIDKVQEDVYSVIDDALGKYWGHEIIPEITEDLKNKLSFVFGNIVCKIIFNTNLTMY